VPARDHESGREAEARPLWWASGRRGRRVAESRTRRVGVEGAVACGRGQRRMKGRWVRKRGDDDRARQRAVRGVDVGIESASANTPTSPRFPRSTVLLTLHRFSYETSASLACSETFPLNSHRCSMRIAPHASCRSRCYGASVVRPT